MSEGLGVSEGLASVAMAFVIIYNYAVGPGRSRKDRNTSSRRPTRVTAAPHARPRRSTRAAKPTDPTRTLNHGPATRSAKLTRARPSPRPERRSADGRPLRTVRTGLRPRSGRFGGSRRSRADALGQLDRPVARVARHTQPMSWLDDRTRCQPAAASAAVVRETAEGAATTQREVAGRSHAPTGTRAMGLPA